MLFSLSIEKANPTFKNIIQLHYYYPIHFLIDFFPFVFGFIFLLIGIKRRRYNSSKIRLKKLLVEQDHAIRETNKKLSAFFNSSSDINILLNLDNTIIAYNKAASAFMKRIESEQPLHEGNDIRNYISSVAKDSFSISFNVAANGKRIKFVENYRLFRSLLSVNSLWLFIELHPVFNDANNVEAVSMNILDITKRKEIEQAIMIQNKQLRKIAWVQSHQLRRPVANILGLATLFNKEEMTESNTQILQHLLESTDELDSYIREIVKNTVSISETEVKMEYTLKDDD